LEYPREWGFKIIGRDKEKLKDAIKEVLKDKEHTTKEGNSSKSGKFHTMNATCQVNSQEERDRLFKAFSDHDDIDIVI
jgi:putative lipoic acid-binding regulatory protein